jgi:non-ribosomal peptide synthetase component F
MAHASAPAARTGSTAYLIYTSDSSGAPKGVVVRQAGLHAMAAAHAAHLEGSARSRVSQLGDPATHGRPGAGMPGSR